MEQRSTRRCRPPARGARSVSRPTAGGSISAAARPADTWAVATPRPANTPPATIRTAVTPSCRASNPAKSGSSTTAPATWPTARPSPHRPPTPATNQSPAPPAAYHPTGWTSFASPTAGRSGGPNQCRGARRVDQRPAFARAPHPRGSQWSLIEPRTSAHSPTGWAMRPAAHAPHRMMGNTAYPSAALRAHPCQRGPEAMIAQPTEQPENQRSLAR